MIKHLTKLANWLSACFLLLVFFRVSAQNSPVPGEVRPASGSLSGSVLDSLTHQPVAFATVVLFPAIPSTKAVAGQAADEKGHFEITRLKTSSYRLQVSFVGFRATTRTVTVESGPVTLDPILLSAAAQKLGEAVVVGQKPVMEVKPDRLVYNADQDVTNAGGTAQDVLRKAPLLAIDGDDNVTLRGSSNFKVLINNKTSPTMAANLRDALKSIPADQIQSVEVITTPPAKYDAEGTAGIINIILKKGTRQGLNGNVGSGAGDRNSTTNVALNFRQGKFNLTSSLSGGLNYNSPTSSFNQQVTFRPMRNDTVTQNGNSTYHSSYGSASVGLDYDPAEHHSLSLNASFFGFNTNNTIGNFNHYTSALPGFSNFFLRDTRSYYVGNNLEVTGVYTRTFKQARREWSILGQYAYTGTRNGYDFDQFNNSNQVLNANLADYRERSRNQLPGHEYTLQSDYAFPFDDTKLLEVGLKGILRQTDSRAVLDTLFSVNTADFTTSPLRSTNFAYHQEVEAAYATYSSTIGKQLRFGLGGRLERTGLSAEFYNTYSSIPYRSYITPLPNANLSYTLSKTSSLRLGYSRRISRPYSNYLNPYINRSNPIFNYYGNPNLDPELTHSVELSYNNSIKTTSFNLSLSVLRTGNSIERVNFASTRPLLPLPEEIVPAPNLVLQTYANIGSNTILQGSGFISATLTSKWRLSANGTLQYLMLYSAALDLDRRGWTGSYNVNTSYAFTKTLTLQGVISQNLPRPLLQGRSNGSIYYGFGLRQKLYKDKVDVALNVNYLFTAKRTYVTSLATPDFTQYNTFDPALRQFRVSFTYRFGKQPQTNRNRKSIRNDDIKGGNSQGSSGQ